MPTLTEETTALPTLTNDEIQRYSRHLKVNTANSTLRFILA